MSTLMRPSSSHWEISDCIALACKDTTILPDRIIDSSLLTVRLEVNIWRYFWAREELCPTSSLQSFSASEKGCKTCNEGK
jgi:hypothetical protein